MTTSKLRPGPDIAHVIDAMRDHDRDSDSDSDSASNPPDSSQHRLKDATEAARSELNAAPDAPERP